MENEYLLRFSCLECGSGFLFDPDETDPTSSHGVCKTCGSDKYSIHLTDATKKDVFVAEMSGKRLKYNIIDYNIA